MSKQENLLEQSPGNATADEEIITQITLAGLKVIMLRKGDQIIYKLPDDMALSSLPDDQRERLENEIRQLHAATLAAAASRTPSHSDPPPIAPRQNNMPVPQPIAAAPAPDPTKDTVQNEDNEQQSPAKEVKMTRKYVKTGKYSKKKQQQQQQQQQQPLGTIPPQAATVSPSGSTAPQPLTPQQQQQSLVQLMAAAPLPPLAPPPPSQPPQEDQVPQPRQPAIQSSMTLPSFLSSKSILAKRLPEEEGHHQEIKRRIYESISADHKAVTNPNYEEPFESVEDAIRRLLPYHIYQYPKADLEVNKIPLESQDHLTVEIFKAQVEMLKKFRDVSARIREGKGVKQIQVMLERQLIAEQRQRLAEEQTRVAAEQQAEAAKAQVEQAHLNSANYVTAFLQNPQFMAQYNQLTPELRQQLFQNQEQLAALLEKHTKDLAATSTTQQEQETPQQQHELQAPISK